MSVDQDLTPVGKPGAASPQGPVTGLVNPAPEQTFFADPAMDRLFGVLLNLSSEVFVLREQCAAMQSQLEASGVLQSVPMKSEPTPDEQATRAASQQAFVDHLLEPLLGTQLTKGVPQTGAK